MRHLFEKKSNMDLPTNNGNRRDTPSPIPPASEEASRDEKVASWFEDQGSASGPRCLSTVVPHSQYTNGVSPADGTSSGQTD